MQHLLLLIALDIALVATCSVIAGITAPRWPDSWLERDRGPLRTWGWETPARYRRLHVPWLTRVLPEAGALFGGESKSELPGTTADALAGYLVEVRRAEWVHWWSSASALLTFAFNPWWLALGFTAVVLVVNGLFLLVLRNNRLRIERILGRSTA